MQETNALELREATVSYNSHHALDRVTVDIPCGRRVAVIGPNGAGKSTLFKAIVGILPLSHGTVRVFGHSPQDRRVPVSYVSQSSGMDLRFPVTVYDVVMMGRYAHIGWMRWPTKHDKEIVMDALSRVGMANLASRQISELSGGQQQRVFVARALAQEAQLLLLDEPFRGIDVPSQEAILSLLEDLKGVCSTILLSTHDIELAADAFDLMLLLNHKLVAFGTPAHVFRPEILREAFGGQVTTWPVAGGGTLVVGDTHCSHSGCVERHEENA
ncbi:MAG: metal ABC transporter ATP-binding protein [Chloroflexi bacterium]|nr:metal ABC transporter ATP-binding protein [Chloroflexota bacterium]